MVSTPKAAIYLRVSCANKDQKTDSQRYALEEYCKMKGYEICGIYEDIGFSGAKSSRPQLDQLMVDARQGKFDVVVVFRFDRFSRSTRHLLQSLEEFRSLKVGFCSVSESIDTQSPMGEAMFTIIAALAALERATIVERIKAGLHAARAKGKILGRKKEREDMKIILLREQGFSLREIAKQLGISKGSVQAALAT